MRATPLVAGAGLVVGVAVIPVGINTELAEPRGIWAVFGPLIGWSFIGGGCTRPAALPAVASACCWS
jgi:hypothetical protein